ncbi:MAG: hypothetical protein ABIJ96_17285 [Elusimicrobiota bacterium]
MLKIFSSLLSVSLLPGLVFGGEVSGKVQLAGESSHAGIVIEVWGTPVKAETDDLGSYLIPDFPSGSHHVIAWKSGWMAAQVSNFNSTNSAQIPLMVLNRPSPGMEAAVLVENHGESMWVSANQESVAKMMAEYDQYQGWWIGGIVRKDEFQEHKFFFDPSTIIIAEYVAEQGLQATIRKIRDDVDAHEGQRRYIEAKFTGYRNLHKSFSGSVSDFWNRPIGASLSPVKDLIDQKFGLGLEQPPYRYWDSE